MGSNSQLLVADLFTNFLTSHFSQDCKVFKLTICLIGWFYVLSYFWTRPQFQMYFLIFPMKNSLNRFPRILSSGASGREIASHKEKFLCHSKHFLIIISDFPKDIMEILLLCLLNHTFYKRPLVWESLIVIFRPRCFPLSFHGSSKGYLPFEIFSHPGKRCFSLLFDFNHCW